MTATKKVLADNSTESTMSHGCVRETAENTAPSSQQHRHTHNYQIVCKFQGIHETLIVHSS